MPTYESKPYSSRVSLGFLAIAIMALAAAPFIASAQTGYGGGGGGGTGIYGPGGYTGFSFTAANPGSPQGLVLGATTFNFTRTLTLGMQGEDVTELQMILIEEGFLVLDGPSGYFGSLTEEAVKAYQKAHGLLPVGIVGPLTRAHLNALVASLAPHFPSMTSGNAGNNPLLPKLQLQLLNLLNQLRAMLGQR